MELRLIVLSILGAFGGSFANAAIDAWAWNPRRISPWLQRDENTPPRTWFDRIPILGWWRLRREKHLHGSGFWIRPLLIELACVAGITWLYWYEVVKLGLIEPQLPAGIAIDPTTLSGIAHVQFVSHAILAFLMLVASFIDIDDRIIPDQITVPGTVLGLLIATVVPLALLPNITPRIALPVMGTLVTQPSGMPVVFDDGSRLYVEPAHAAAPNPWPDVFQGGSLPALAIGFGCWWLWCFALTRRIWRGRRGPLFALSLISARIVRDLTSLPLFILLIGGTLCIIVGWFYGGGAWLGLLTALIGLVISGGIVWAIRIVGSLAMRREAMGFGDVTLMMMIGTFLGWQACLITFFLAPFAAIVLGIIQLLLRRGDVLPYGPFLCLAAATVVIAWPRIWEITHHAFELPLLLAAVLLVCFVLLGCMLFVWQKIKEAIVGIRYE